MKLRWFPLVALGFLCLATSIGAEVVTKPLADGQSAAVTFRLLAPAAKTAAVGGSWNDWSDTHSPMSREADGWWTWTIVVPSSALLEYKFVLDGEWVADPKAPAQKDDGFGSFNGVVAVGKLLPAEVSKAASSVPTSNPKNLGFQVEALADGKTVRITLRNEAPAAQAVYLAGTMNNWDKTATPMVKATDGIWTASFVAAKDDVILYRYVTDGEWLWDQYNVAKRDDGFGKYNSVIDVAQALSGGKSSSSSGLSFGTYTDLRLSSRFLTKNIKDGTKDGYALDSLDFFTSSDWNLYGEILPGVSIYTDLKVLNGGLQLYKANSLGSKDPIVGWNQGLVNLANLPFRPFSALGKPNATNDINSANPLLGTFKVKLDTDFVTFASGTGWARGTNYTPALWKTSAAADNDANDGFLEIGLGNKVQKLGDKMKLEAVVGPNKRDGYGVYSWAGVQASDWSVGLAFNTKNSNTTVSLGATNRWGNYLLKGQVLQSTAWGTQNRTRGAFSDNGAAGASLQYTDDRFSWLVQYQLAGLYAASLYGDDTELATGSQTLVLGPAVTVGPWTLGFDSISTAKNDFRRMLSSDLANSFTPYLSVGLDGVGLPQVRADLYGTMDLNGVGGKDFGYRFNQFGTRIVNSAALGPFQKLSVLYTLTATYFDYDPAGKNYPLNKVYNIVLAQASIGSDMNLLAGVGKRDLSSNSFQKVSTDQLVPLGFALGWTWKIPSSEWKKPLLYAQYTWRLDPFGDSPSFDLPLTPTNPNTGIVSGTTGWGTFAPKILDSNDSKLQVGLRWQF